MTEPTPRLDDVVVTDEDLAAFLGVTTTQLAKRRIPHVGIGQRRLYLVKTVIAWLEEQEAR